VKVGKRRKTAYVTVPACEVKEAVARLNGSLLEGHPIRVFTQESPMRDTHATQMQGGCFVCASLHIIEHGKRVTWTPPANFTLCSNREASFIDRQTNQRYHASEDEAKTYACLAYIFERRHEFVKNCQAMALWNISSHKEGDIAEEYASYDTEGDFKPAIHMISSWRSFSIPGCGHPRKSHGNQPNLTPNLVAVQLKKGAIVHYRVDPCNHALRCSLFNISRPFPCFKGLDDKGVFFTGIVDHSITTPICVRIQLLGRTKMMTLRLQDLIKQHPKMCFDYAMRNKLHHTRGFVSLLSRTLQCGEFGAALGTISRPTWGDFGARGCGKCRQAGCRACFQRRYGRIQVNSIAECKFFRLDSSGEVDCGWELLEEAQLKAQQLLHSH
jgi:hypothetical protein